MSSKASGKSTDIRTVQSVDRAIGLIKSLADRPEGMSLSALAEASDLPPQTTQSLIRTLQHHGWVAQAGRGTPYLLGSELTRLSYRWSTQKGWLEGARNIARQVGDEIGEYIILAEIRTGLLIPLFEQQSSAELMVNTRNDFTDRYHSTAIGKIMLASLPAEQRRDYVCGLELPKHGPKTICNHDRLLRELATVAKRGYSVCREESSAHVAALAVSITDTIGSVRAALGSCAPLVRFDAKREQALLKRLQEAAEDIGRLM